MSEKVIELLAPKPGEKYLDLTAGYGGHAAKIAQILGEASLTLVDRDRDAVTTLKRKFPAATVWQLDYAQAVDKLLAAGHVFGLILADLGVSSPQLETGARGFSFAKPGPLDMRMDQNQTLSAAEIVNHAGETDLADIIYRLGDERYSRRIARAIVARRPIHGTTELADVVSAAVPYRGRIHPATRTFQALRIAVNDELGQLERTLPKLAELLVPGGRVAIISFHSLEDRLVKQAFKTDFRLSILTKKPLSGKLEDVNNPRARSAKLRVALKLAGGRFQPK